MPAIDSRSFRQFMGGFATGITVVTLRNEKQENVGLTINSLTSVSLDPALILFCLDRRAQLYPAFRKAEHFAVNILSESQEDISQHFAYSRFPLKTQKIWGAAQDGCPVLKNTLGWMLCRTSKIYKAGDHDIFVGDVLKLNQRPNKENPLLYFRSRYRTIGAI